MAQGPDVLRNAELLAIILNTGYKDESVLELASRILAEYGSKGVASERNVSRLMAELGIPQMKASQIDEVISIGTLDANLVHPREVFQPAIEFSAAAAIISHNHPSGDPAPSAEDRAVTQRLAEAGTLLGIELLDHVIIAKNGFVSVKQ